MCGLVGYIDTHQNQRDDQLIERMMGTISYRGPDHQGVYREGPLSFGHCRLSILDLSPAGHQPMISPSKEVVLIYNGEVYNFRELRKELETAGIVFRSKSDTEVILQAYLFWGEACVHRFNGMFAFVLWDRRHQKLFIARDRYGIKPLYWYYQEGLLLFASEVKAILKHPEVRREISPYALDEYFSFQNIFTDLTLFEGVRLLPPGSFLTFHPDAKEGPKISRYWDYPFSADRLKLSEEEATEELYSLFVRAVNRQLVSDVPIGAYLSGGMDSGSLVAVARPNLGRLTTFTGGFDLSSASGLELGFDERGAAEVLANSLKTEHYEMVMHAGDMEAVLPELIWHLEDLRVGQCYPNYYVARLAGKFVKVVLSGVGGDELFGGYPWRYYDGLKSRNGNEFLESYYAFWQRLVTDEEKPLLFNAPVRNALKGRSTFDIFRGVFEETSLPLQSSEDFVNASLYFELKTFLHGLLVVEDKVSMAHSLETRVPFLDNDLVDFACRLPVKYKLKSSANALESVDEDDLCKYDPAGLRMSSGKAVLRKAMERLIPKQVTSRAKQGFSAPDASWFRGESIDYVNRLLRDRKARIYTYLEPAYVTQRLDEHTSGRSNNRLFIWSLVSFEWWLRQFMESS